MFITSVRTGRALAIPAAVSVAFAFGACGSSGVDTQKIQSQGAALQQQGEATQKVAAKLAADVKSGKLSAEEASKKLRETSDKLATQAKKTASGAIDAVKDDASIPAEAKKQLEDAQSQLQTP